MFQHPLESESFDPRFTVEPIIREPLENFFPERSTARRVAEVLAAVEIDSVLRSRRPTELSGGQRRRVAIARPRASARATALRRPGVQP
ncbi:MAG: ATP-binding cassette domain-containing protein [Acidimicrobiales bacterium]